MKLLVSGATDTLRRLIPESGGLLGSLVVPGAWNDPAELAALGGPMAGDNGCFNGLDSRAFVAMLNEYREAAVGLEWVTVPDVVADAEGTFRQWRKWEPVVRAFGFRPCLVLQDGLELTDLIALDPPAVFVGGSTEFKLGPVARKCVRWARANGKPAHMGRVNTKGRIEYAVGIGCTSFDGTGQSEWPDTNIPKCLRWVRRAMAVSRAPGLFD